ncbi:MAG TPA: hypothetical protein VGR48_17905 [Terriglobales bacterium]|nr:hypothetical protein [Terriglobales bacterium]
MSSTASAIVGASHRKCAFCAEEILAAAKKCRHCGEFVSTPLSMTVGVLFALGVVIACLMAGSPERVTVVGVWAIFALLFSKTFGRG